MNDETTNLDQADDFEADEDIFIYTVSDEAIEAAAGETEPLYTPFQTAGCGFSISCCP
jgi:hypothetical protein